MFPLKFVPVAHVLALCTTMACAQTSPPAPAMPATSGAAAQSVVLVDPQAVQALKKMSSHLQTLQRFQVSNHTTSEKVLADGQKLQTHARATIQVQKPNKLRAQFSNGRNERIFVYDGQDAVLYTPSMKYYAKTPVPNTIAAMLTHVQDKYDVELPMMDVLQWAGSEDSIKALESAMYAGQDTVGDDLCDHYAFRQANVDWQIWIPASGQPLPRKIVITNRSDEAHPQSVALLQWNLRPSFSANAFRFSPPKGAQQIQLRTVDAQ